MADPIGYLLGLVSPGRALKRERDRFRLHAARALRKRMYEGAKTKNRHGKSKALSTGANAEIAQGHDGLKFAARDAVRNDPHASRALSIITSNVVGTGIVMRSATGDVTLDARVDALYAKFARKADADGDLTLDGLIALAVRSMIEGGDAFIRRRWRRASDGLPVPMQLQLMEGDYLDTAMDGRGVDPAHRQGIGFDEIDRRRAYRLFRQHPGEHLASGIRATSRAPRSMPAT